MQICIYAYKQIYIFANIDERKYKYMQIYIYANIYTSNYVYVK